MRVALTGVSGFIGSYIAKRLTSRGHEVTGLVRATSRRDHVEPYVDRFVEGAHSDRGVFDAFLRDADAVVHNSFDWKVLKRDHTRHYDTNLVASIDLLNASEGRPFVFMSTIAVHHDMRPRWGGMIDEDHPLRPSNDYGACKAAVEAHLWSRHYGNGQSTCALRPCGVYGLDPLITRSYCHGVIAKLRRGDNVDKPGGGKFVHVEDIAAATVAAIEQPEKAAGHAYNLVDCYARWCDWSLIAAEELGIDPPDVDTSSPTAPKNVFDMAAIESLGVTLDRGIDGIRAYVRELIAAIDADR